jgi:hypothetical protein
MAVTIPERNYHEYLMSCIYASQLGPRRSSSSYLGKRLHLNQIKIHHFGIYPRQEQGKASPAIGETLEYTKKFW